MSKRDYYEILGLKKDANAQEIKKAYRKLAKEKHPDSGGNEEEFKEIAEAYDVLSDDSKRQQYDTFGHNQPRGGGGGFKADFSDLFNQFGFGGRQQRQRQRRGQDLRLNIHLSLEDIYNGGVKKIKYNRYEACMSCNSVGGHDPITCPSCGGQGMVVEQIRTPFGVMQNMTTCSRCDGEGKTYSRACNDCSGAGVKQKEEILDIQIPIGVADGMSMAYAGLGQAVKNGTSGQLIITFNETPNKRFVRNGNDLKYSLKLPYHTMVLGGKAEIDTIDGGKISIAIPELNKIGDTLRVRGKGMKLLNSELRGDLDINLDIQMPQILGEEEKEILEKLKNLHDNVVENEN